MINPNELKKTWRQSITNANKVVDHAIFAKIYLSNVSEKVEKRSGSVLGGLRPPNLDFGALNKQYITGKLLQTNAHY